MKIKNSGMRRNFYALNNNRATKQCGTKSAFFFLWRRAELPPVLMQVDPYLDA